MHPALSVIFLTTLIGAAQGLFLALFGVELGSSESFLLAHTQRFFVAGSVVALLFSGLGLLASFFHLGHPERAWRSAAMWRTSWLSREVIALPVFMLGVFLYGLSHLLGWGVSRWIGAVTLVACLALFVCTGMIYASIRFLQEWASPLTLVNYFLLGCASGLLLATLMASLAAMASHVQTFLVITMILTAVGWATRSASLVRNARLKPKSTLQSAIGVKHPKIVQKAQGFMGGSFNTREFFHGRSTEMLRTVKWTFLILTFAVPLLLLAFGLKSPSTPLFLLAITIQFVGLLAERWFFFAQANHPQNLYYQNIS